MKHLLLTTIAAVLVVGCGESQPDISIHDAARTGDIEAVKKHLAAGTDVDAKGDGGYIPLHLAANGGQREVVELLIAKGTDVNVKNDDNGRTPLHYAAYRENKVVKEVIELLISKGASVNAQDVAGRTPLNVAIRRKHPETADLLRKHGGKIGEEFSIHVAAEFGNIEAVKKHLADGSDVNAQNESGTTPLGWAGYYGYKELIELLIAEGADVNAKGTDGITALHYAALTKRLEAVELLIANGADVNVMNDDGETPLDETNSHNKPEIADLLRKHGGKTRRELKAEGK